VDLGGGAEYHFGGVRRALGKVNQYAHDNIVSLEIIGDRSLRGKVWSLKKGFWIAKRDHTVLREKGQKQYQSSFSLEHRNRARSSNITRAYPAGKAGPLQRFSVDQKSERGIVSIMRDLQKLPTFKVEIGKRKGHRSGGSYFRAP